jgi:hypothetical protein
MAELSWRQMALVMNLLLWALVATKEPKITPVGTTPPAKVVAFQNAPKQSMQMQDSVCTVSPKEPLVISRSPPARSQCPAIPIVPKDWYTGGAFYTAIADIAGTDKATGHKYHYLYSKYLDPLQPGTRRRLFEIGLGCGVIWGPGRSHILWKKYLPQCDRWFFDYKPLEKKCRKLLKHASYLTNTDREYIFSHILWSDQANVTEMTRKIPSAVGKELFDVVIDDGGHFMEGNIASFNTLFPRAVLPGGLYAVEDLVTSFVDMFGGTKEHQRTGDTMVEMLKGMLRHMVSNYTIPMPKRVVPDAMALVQSMECDREICFMRRKP